MYSGFCVTGDRWLTWVTGSVWKSWTAGNSDSLEPWLQHIHSLNHSFHVTDLCLVFLTLFRANLVKRAPVVYPVLRAQRYLQSLFITEI